MTPAPPAPTPDDDRATTLRVFGTALLLYALFLWPLAGENPLRYLDLARALVEHGSLQIDAFAANTSDKALVAGHTYLAAAPAPAFVGAPAYALGALLGGPTLGLLLMTFVLGPLAGAVALAGFYRLTAVAYPSAGTREDRLWLTAALGVGTFLFPLSTVLYTHALAAAATTWSAAFAFEHARGREAGFRDAALAGLLAGCLPACDYFGALITAWLGGAVVFAGDGTPRERGLGLAWFCAGCALPGALLAAYHTACFGGPFTTGYAFHASPNIHAIQAQGVAGFEVPTAHTVWAVTLGRARGLLPFAPPVAVAWAALPSLCRRAGWRPLAWAAPGVVFLALHAARLSDWYAGLTWGPRYQTLALPFWLLLLATPARPAWTRRALVWATAVGGAVNLIGAGVRWPHTVTAAFDQAAHFGVQSKAVSAALTGNLAFYPVPTASGTLWTLAGTALGLVALTGALHAIWRLERRRLQQVALGVAALIVASFLAATRSLSQEAYVHDLLRKRELVEFALALGGRKNTLVAAEVNLELGEGAEAARLAERVLSETPGDEHARLLIALGRDDVAALRALTEASSPEVRRRARRALERKGFPGPSR